MATRMEAVQLENKMDTEDYRKLQSLFMVGLLTRACHLSRATVVHSSRAQCCVLVVMAHIGTTTARSMKGNCTTFSRKLWSALLGYI